MRAGVHSRPRGSNHMTRSHRSRPSALAAVVLAICLGACGPGALDDNAGTLSLPLTGTSADGTTYRLSGAFAIAGPVSHLLSAETPEVGMALPPGGYTITLQSGWVLYRLDGPLWVPVSATLTSPNPASFTI